MMVTREESPFPQGCCCFGWGWMSGSQDSEIFVLFLWSSLFFLLRLLPFSSCLSCPVKHWVWTCGDCVCRCHGLGGLDGESGEASHSLEPTTATRLHPCLCRLRLVLEARHGQGMSAIGPRFGPSTPGSLRGLSWRGRRRWACTHDGVCIPSLCPRRILGRGNWVGTKPSQSTE